MGNGQPQQAPVTLTITMTPQGTQVHGPLDNRMLCYALLEIARDSVREYVPPAKGLIEVAERPPVQVPHLVAPRQQMAALEKGTE